MLDVLYDQQGLMNVDGKTAKESADDLQRLREDARGVR